jgi:hypothetical protein
MWHAMLKGLALAVTFKARQFLADQVLRLATHA